jgi:hypothetical protein
MVSFSRKGAKGAKNFIQPQRRKDAELTVFISLRSVARRLKICG